MLSAAKSEWIEQSKVDKEFGGDKLKENLAVANKALKAFGSPELVALFEQSGLGDHPEIIRVFYRAGKTISEDHFVGHDSTGKEVRDPAEIMFPSMNKSA